jgi:branched-chain amino acid transport system substrate-binding protein
MIHDIKTTSKQRINFVNSVPKAICFILSFLFFFLSTTPVCGNETIDIAAIYALTGAAAEANSYALRGAGYAVDEINSQGGVLGKTINLLMFDNQSSPIGSTIAAKKAAAANVLAIVGPDWSSHAIAVARVAQDNGIPMISSLSTNPETTKIGEYIFRACFTDDFQGKVIARFARQDLNATTAVIFVDVTSDYSLKLSEIFQTNFEKLGGRVVLELEYKLKQHLIDKDVQKTVKVDADVIFIPGHDESGSIAKQIQDAGGSSIFLGGDGWGNPIFFRKGGSGLKRGYYSTHWSVHLDTDRSRTFVNKYIHSEASVDNIALGYDAMMLLTEAINRAQSFDKKKIRDAIANTPSFEGVTGIFDFNNHGDPLKSAVFMEIRNGKPHYLKTLKP